MGKCVGVCTRVANDTCNSVGGGAVVRIAHRPCNPDGTVGCTNIIKLPCISTALEFVDYYLHILICYLDSIP